MRQEPLLIRNEEAFMGEALPVEPFNQTLSKHGLKLNRAKTTTLQINVGFLCDQVCRHCHLNAGPARKEIMDQETVDEVVSYAKRAGFETIDITGGAPELNPNIIDLIKKISPLAPKIMFRSSLFALSDKKRADLVDVLKAHQVVIVASFPSLNEAQADAMRGDGAFKISIETLRSLNQKGYGQGGSGLELNLVSNPTGAFLPSSQSQTEKRFHQILERKWGIVFNNLYHFANVPLGRFRQWLEKSDNLREYLDKLAANFNRCAIEGLMCRTLVSVSWDGYLYDCDFNLARGLYLGGQRMHVSEMSSPPEEGQPIIVADHCYTCTAGAGFT